MFSHIKHNWNSNQSWVCLFWRWISINDNLNLSIVCLALFSYISVYEKIEILMSSSYQLPNDCSIMRNISILRETYKGIWWCTLEVEIISDHYNIMKIVIIRRSDNVLVSHPKLFTLLHVSNWYSFTNQVCPRFLTRDICIPRWCILSYSVWIAYQS